MSDEDERLTKLLNVIKAWIESESGPAHMDFSSKALALRVKIRGWKRITLERDLSLRDTEAGDERQS